MERWYFWPLCKHWAVCPHLLIPRRKLPACEQLYLIAKSRFWDIFWDTFCLKSLTECSVGDFCGGRDSAGRGPALSRCPPGGSGQNLWFTASGPSGPLVCFRRPSSENKFSADGRRKQPVACATGCKSRLCGEDDPRTISICLFRQVWGSLIIY